MRGDWYRVRRVAVALAVVAALGLAGCSGGGKPDASWQGGEGAGQSAPPESTAIAKITAPADGATNVPAAAEIVFSTEQAASSKFELKDADGNLVKGSLREDRTSGCRPRRCGTARSTPRP